MINHIKEYTERGWVIHPLSAPTDQGSSPGKKPLLAGWQNLKHTPMIHQFPPGCNIGLVCGKASGVTVIDYDSCLFILDCFCDPENDSLESRRTTDRGHIFYKYDPDMKSQKHHLLGIEILNDGSNAVLPPSVHKSGDVYKWLRETTQVIRMPTNVKKGLLNMFSIESELKQRISKCRHCFKQVLKDYPDNVPDMHGADGRQFMLAMCTDLIALGAKEEHMKMFCKLMYKEKYNEAYSLDELKYLNTWKTWRCETLREKLPAYVNCTECVSYKFRTPQETERMTVTIPAGVTEVTLTIERER